MALAHKIPYVNFDGTSGKIGFILLGLSILVLIELSLELISAIAEMIKRNKRKEKFNNWMRTLDAESFSIVYQFYYHNSTILNYSDKLPVKLQISGIIKNAAHDCYSISQENFDFLTEFFDK